MEGFPFLVDSAGVYHNLYSKIKKCGNRLIKILGELSYACQVLAFLYRQGKDSS